jgi:nucleoside-diphosphate-sugar epimerase
MNQHIFLIGATGFIGEQVLQSLLARPNVTLSALVRTAASAKKVASRGATAVLGDLEQDGAWQQALANVDVVVHVAQPSTFGQRVTKKAALAYEKNRLAMDQRLFSALPKNKPMRLVYVAGNSYYGETGSGPALGEKMTPQPTGFGPYIVNAVHKAEALASDAVQVVVAFPGAVYGDGSWLKQYFIDPIAAGQPVMRVSGPAHWASPVHVEDAGAAIAHLAALPPSLLASKTERFFIVDHQPATYDDIAKAVSARLAKPLKTRSIPGWLLGLFAGDVVRSYMQTDSKYTSAKLQATGFRFTFPTIATGISALKILPNQSSAA